MKDRQTKHQGSFYRFIERLSPEERAALMEIKHAPGREPPGITTKKAKEMRNEGSESQQDRR